MNPDENGGSLLPRWKGGGCGPLPTIAAALSDMSLTAEPAGITKVPTIISALRLDSVFNSLDWRKKFILLKS
jgi:hypothetical protein